MKFSLAARPPLLALDMRRKPAPIDPFLSLPPSVKQQRLVDAKMQVDDKK
jgi:hypothetical protein